MKLVTITEAFARAALENTRPNRTPKHSHMLNLADDQKNHRWIVNGEAIRFDVHGRLGDGQHRMLARLHSGTDFESYVQYGVPDEAFSTIDGGITRSVGDQTAIENPGVRDFSGILSAAVVLVKAYSGLEYTKASGRARRVKENNADDLLAQAASKTREFLQKHKKAKALQPAATAVLFYLADVAQENGDEQCPAEMLAYLESLRDVNLGGPNTPTNRVYRNLTDRTLRTNNAGDRFRRFQITLEGFNIIRRDVESVYRLVVPQEVVMPYAEPEVIIERFS